MRGFPLSFFLILLYLHHENAIGMSTIARALGLSKKAVEYAIPRLIRRGLIERERLGRAYIYKLTPQGREFIDTLLNKIRKYLH